MTVQPARARSLQGLLFQIFARHGQLPRRRPLGMVPAQGRSPTGQAPGALAHSVRSMSGSASGIRALLVPTFLALSVLGMAACTTPGPAESAPKSSSTRETPASAPGAPATAGANSKAATPPSPGTGNPVPAAGSDPAKPVAVGNAPRPPDRPASSPAAPVDSLARTAQELLNALGFGPLKLDGYWGPQSRRALEQFLAKRKDKSPPVPTANTVELLREAARAAGVQGASGGRAP